MSTTGVTTPGSNRPLPIVLVAALFLSPAIFFLSSPVVAAESQSFADSRQEGIEGEYQNMQGDAALLRQYAGEAIQACDHNLFIAYTNQLNGVARNARRAADYYQEQKNTGLLQLAEILRQLASLIEDPNVSAAARDLSANILTDLAGIALEAAHVSSGVGLALSTSVNVAQSVINLRNQAHAAGVRDDILAEAQKQVEDIARIEPELQKWKDLSNQIEESVRDLNRQWQERAPFCDQQRADATTAGQPSTDGAAWLQVAKGTIADGPTGQPLDGQVVVIPGGEGETARPGDDPQIRPGDTVVVSAPCHERRSYVVGQDPLPEGLRLNRRPLRFVGECPESGWLTEETIQQVTAQLNAMGFPGPLQAYDVDVQRAPPVNNLRMCEIIVYVPVTEAGTCPATAKMLYPIPSTATVPPADPSSTGPGTTRGPGDRGWVERDEPREGQAEAAFPNDPLYQSKGSWGQSYDDQWALKRIGFSFEKGQPDASLWPEKGHPVIVAVIDTGIDRFHPDLLGAIWINRKEIPGNKKDDDNNVYVDDVYGWNFVDNNNNTSDNNGHGTFVAGIIAAWPNNGIGIAGVNPWARIMPIKVTDFNNKGWSIDIAKAIVYAVNNGARVINISIGGKRLTKVEQAAIDYANSKGVVIVVASGNKGVNTNDFSPAGLRGVITVASTDTSDKRVGFSNWGREVDIAAPGVDILSLRARKTDLLLLESKDYKPGVAFVGKDKRYYRTAGSSFSAPFVTGVASLILARNPNLTGEQVKRMILYSAKDIDVPGKDQYTGYGLLDAKAALAADPNFFVETEIFGVKLVKKGAELFLEVAGTADANQFKEAWLEIGQGSNPSQWRNASQRIRKPVTNGLLDAVPVSLFRGAKEWIIRLVAEHQNGKKREARYTLKLQ